MKPTINLDSFKVGEVYELNIKEEYGLNPSDNNRWLALCLQEEIIDEFKKAKVKFLLLSGLYKGRIAFLGCLWLRIFCTTKQVVTSFEEKVQ